MKYSDSRQAKIVYLMARQGSSFTYTHQLEMESGIPIYWVLTAYDESGNESGYSNEVTHTIYIDNNAPAVPQIFHIKNYVIIR